MSEINLQISDNLGEELKDVSREVESKDLPLIEEIKKEIKSISYDKEKQIKLGIILVITILIALDSQIGIFSYAPISESCFVDRLLIITKTPAKFYREHKIFRDTLDTAGSLSIDITFLYLGTRWIFFEETWRLFVATMAFYGLRGVVQALYIMKFDEEYFWEAPFLKSLLVGYIHSNDYFFSGHVGFPVIAASEFIEIGQPYFSIPCFIMMIIEFFIVTLARSHYSIDVFAGVIVARYVFVIVNYWEKFIMKKIKEYKDGKSGLIEEKKKEEGIEIQEKKEEERE